MQTDECAETQSFSSFLKEQYLLQPHDLLKEFRNRAWDHFLELGLPERNQEAFQYVPIKQLYQQSWSVSRADPVQEQSIATSIYPECQNSCLVFVNGVYRLDLSNLSALPKQVVVLPLDQAAASYSAFIQSRLAKGIKEETDPFATLNGALYQNGVFIFVPSKIEVPCPIQCIHYVNSDPDLLKMVSPRVHLFVGSHAKLQWIGSSQTAVQSPVFINSVLDVILEEGSSLHVTSDLTIHPEAWQFDAFRATLKRDSRLESISLTNGSKTVRQDYRISLLGEGSAADIKGIWTLSDQNQAHVHALIDHRAPHCESMQLFKGIVADRSRSSFEGKIQVQPIAQQTKAYQLNNNIILGSHALAHCKPNLEIFADDVKASHGATVAKIDPAQLFYLQSRGLSEQRAKSLLLLGFCKEILDQIPHAVMRDEKRTFVESYFKDDALHGIRSVKNP